MKLKKLTAFTLMLVLRLSIISQPVHATDIVDKDIIDIETSEIQVYDNTEGDTVTIHYQGDEDKVINENDVQGEPTSEPELDDDVVFIPDNSEDILTVHDMEQSTPHNPTTTSPELPESKDDVIFIPDNSEDMLTIRDIEENIPNNPTTISPELSGDANQSSEIQPKIETYFNQQPVHNSKGRDLTYLLDQSPSWKYGPFEIRGDRGLPEWWEAEKQHKYTVTTRPEGGYVIQIFKRTALAITTGHVKHNIKIIIHNGAEYSEILLHRYYVSQEGMGWTEAAIEANYPINIQLMHENRFWGYGNVLEVKHYPFSRQNSLIWSVEHAMMVHEPYDKATSGITLHDTHLEISGNAGLLLYNTSDIENTGIHFGEQMWFHDGPSDWTVAAPATLNGRSSQRPPNMDRETTVTASKITPQNNIDWSRLEFSLNNRPWQPGGEISGLRTNTNYWVSWRYAGTDSKFPSKIAGGSFRTSSATYEVSIPKTSNADGGNHNVSAKLHDLGYGGQVDVKVVGGVDDRGRITLTRNGASNTITSLLCVNGKPINETNNVVATFTSSNNGIAKLSALSPTEKNIPAGNYSGTVTFQVIYSEP